MMMGLFILFFLFVFLFTCVYIVLKLRGIPGKKAAFKALFGAFFILIVLLLINFYTVGILVDKDVRFTRDWVNIQPLTSTIFYDGSNGVFEGSFNNVAGTSINITNVSMVVNEIYRFPCKDIILKQGGYEYLIDKGVTVSPSATFTITALCGTISDGGSYELNFLINYTTVGDGVSIQHLENGTIGGDSRL